MTVRHALDKIQHPRLVPLHRHAYRLPELEPPPGIRERRDNPKRRALDRRQRRLLSGTASATSSAHATYGSPMGIDAAISASRARASTFTHELFAEDRWDAERVADSVNAERNATVATVSSAGQPHATRRRDAIAVDAVDLLL